MLNAAYCLPVCRFPRPAQKGGASRYRRARTRSESSACRLRVYDVSGRLVATLLDGPRGPGTHRVEWNGRTDSGREVATGIYLCRLETERGHSERKMLLLR